jgi:hypothetical protein
MRISVEMDTENEVPLSIRLWEIWNAEGHRWLGIENFINLPEDARLQKMADILHKNGMAEISASKHGNQPLFRFTDFGVATMIQIITKMEGYNGSR